MCSHKSITITATDSIATFVKLTNNHQNIEYIKNKQKNDSRKLPRRNYGKNKGYFGYIKWN